jgi:glycosyltransferase involved in cell wall biosynthesis
MQIQKDIKKRYAVFIPCYNAIKTIEETLKSVEEAINFSGFDIPVFIYDDCSKDDSFAVCSNWVSNRKDFHLVKNEINCGERKTTNLAFNKFYNVYDWVFIIHADDIVKKDWLVTLVGEIENVNDNSCFTVWSSFDTLIDTTKKIEPGDNSGAVQHVHKDIEYVRHSLIRATSSWHISGCGINMKLFRLLDGFSENMPQLGDTDFVIKGILAGYSDVYISRTLTLYRVLDGSVTATSYKTNRDVKEIYMLLEKYKGVLEKKDILKIYYTIIKMTGRRMVKWALKKELKLAFLNFRQCSKSVVQYVMFSLKFSKA